MQWVKHTVQQNIELIIQNIKSYDVPVDIWTFDLPLLVFILWPPVSVWRKQQKLSQAICLLGLSNVCYTSEGAKEGGKGREEGSAPPGMSTFNPHDHVVSQYMTLPSYPWLQRLSVCCTACLWATVLKLQPCYTISTAQIVSSC